MGKDKRRRRGAKLPGNRPLVLKGDFVKGSCNKYTQRGNKLDNNGRGQLKRGEKALNTGNTQRKEQQHKNKKLKGPGI